MLLALEIKKAESKRKQDFSSEKEQTKSWPLQKYRYLSYNNEL